MEFNFPGDRRQTSVATSPPPTNEQKTPTDQSMVISDSLPLQPLSRRGEEAPCKSTLLYGIVLCLCFLPFLVLLLRNKVIFVSVSVHKFTQEVSSFWSCFNQIRKGMINILFNDGRTVISSGLIYAQRSEAFFDLGFALVEVPGLVQAIYGSFTVLLLVLPAARYTVFISTDPINSHFL
jgi:hypothetical protein